MIPASRLFSVNSIIEPPVFFFGVYYKIYASQLFHIDSEAVPKYSGTMPYPKIHYSVMIIDHYTGERLKVDLIDFLSVKRLFRLRVNGKQARRMPFGSKTAVLDQFRKWWVAR